MPRGKPNYVSPNCKGATFNVAPVKQRVKEPVVYFVQAENGRIKIGNTKYLETRLAIMRGQSPITIELLATVKGGRREEFAYHARFAAYRLHGEWFEPHHDILNEISQINADEPTTRSHGGSHG